YTDISPGFNADTGFVNRTDYRQFSNFVAYTFRPEGKHLVAHGARLYEQTLWDHNDTRLNYQANPGYEWDFQRNTFISVATVLEHERLRPVDFPALPGNRDYAHVVGLAAVGTQYFKWLKLIAEMDWGTATNFVPPATLPPVLAYQNTANVNAT